MSNDGDNLMLRVADFSIYPIGRDEGDGDFNGTKFRREYLLPAVESALKKGQKLKVSFAGVLSFGSSFLEEAFGGLISKEGLDKKDVLRTIILEDCDDGVDRYDGVVLKLIDRATPKE